MMLLTGAKPLAFGPWLNAGLFAGIVYCCGCMMNRFAHSNRWYKAALLSCIVLSPSLQEIYSMLWSETLFLLLSLLLMATLHRYYRERVHWLAALLGLLAGLCFITRYAGIAFIISCAFLLLVSPGTAIRTRLLHITLFLPAAALLPAINLLHNAKASGTLTGFREQALRGLWENLSDTGAEMAEWLPFLKQAPSSAAPWISLLILAALGAAWCRRLFRNKDFHSYENIATGFFLAYTLFMIVSASISRYQPLDNRLLCPGFIPLLWSIGGGLMERIQAGGRARKIWTAIAIILFVCFQYEQVKEDADTWTDISYAGIPGYTEDQWKQSPTVRFMQKNPSFFRDGFGIYSNAHDAIWFFTGKKAELLPHNEFARDIRQFLDQKHCYVVWFDDGYNPDLVGLDFITGEKKMRLLMKFPDGAIYGTE
ncbi:MAG: hypothetical protein JST39_06955 [Bacteroidetes bacterium]|nr:hypothetical protein [Bacteroidota bacterium]